MPKKIDFEEIVENKKFSFDTKLSLFSGSNCIIRAPVPIGKKISDKKIKVTIEVID